MISLQELLQQKIENLGKEKSLNQRQSILKELYEVYLLEKRYDNYYRLKHWLKKNKKKQTPETVLEFQKAKLPITHKYHEPISSKRFAIKLSHIETKDLYFLISKKVDLIHRNGYKRSSFSKWLFFSIKPIKDI